MQRFTPGFCLLIVGLLSARAVGADAATVNWPAWRGPLATGVAPQGNPPVAWSETSNVKWKVAIPGRGKGTPIVWDDLVFVQTATPPARRRRLRRKRPAPVAQPADAVAG